VEIFGRRVSLVRKRFLTVVCQRKFPDSCRCCITSIVTVPAINSSSAKGFDHLEVGFSAGVQQIVSAELGGSALMLPIDNDNGFPSVMVTSGASSLS
jgi:pyruvate,water dikinase